MDNQGLVDNNTIGNQNNGNNKMIKIRNSILFLTIIIFACPLLSEDIIQVYSYYNVPPFITGDNNGLNYQIIDHLNRNFKGSYSFQLSILPRKRLDNLLASDIDAIVLFVNPLWMNDIEKTKYLWTPPLFSDRNVVISNSNNPVLYDGSPDSLMFYKLGGIRGRVYSGLTDLITDGIIIREDAGSERQNIQKLLAGRIDFTTMPWSILKYLIERYSLEENIFISETPFLTYNRHLLITKNLSSLYDQLVPLMEEWEGKN